VQTPEHIIYNCKILEQQRSTLIRSITVRGGKWPPANKEMVDTYFKEFIRFINTINFQQLIWTKIKKEEGKKQCCVQTSCVYRLTKIPKKKILAQ
jgi:hypothetical protein